MKETWKMCHMNPAGVYTVSNRGCRKAPDMPEKYSSIAQSVEHAAVNRAVVGSSPTRGVIFILFCLWLHGQAVKTSPFHGGNTGSIPVGVIDFPISEFTDL